MLCGMSDSKTPKIGKGKAGPGRPKGMKNRVTVLLKEAVLKAASDLGGGEQEGLETFLRQQAQKENNAPFMSLLAKVLPTQLGADPESGEPLVVFINKYAADGTMTVHDVHGNPTDDPLAIDADYKRLSGPDVNS
jgi:hypothetical protein